MRYIYKLRYINSLQDFQFNADEPDIKIMSQIYMPIKTK